jgi:transcriptional regulator with XRE-family HTH domain
MGNMANKEHKAEIAKNRLLEFRKKSGLSKKEVAEKLHVTSASVDRWEKGLGLPNLEHLLHISVIYNTGSEIIYSALYKKLDEEITKRKKKLSARLQSK